MKIRGHILALVALTSLPALLVAATAGGIFVARERDHAASALRQSARMMVGEIDQELLVSIARLEALAGALAHEPVDPSVFSRAARAVLDARPRWKAIMLADVSGRRVLEASGGPRIGWSGVGDRSTFEEVLRTGKPQVSKVLAIPPDGEQLVVLAVPLEGKARHVLLSAVEAGAFGDLLRGRELPPPGRASLVDQAGVTIAGVSDAFPGTAASLLRRAAREPGAIGVFTGVAATTGWSAATRTPAPSPDMDFITCNRPSAAESIPGAIVSVPGFAPADTPQWLHSRRWSLRAGESIVATGRRPRRAETNS